MLYTDTEHYPQILHIKSNLTISSLGLVSLPFFAVIGQSPNLFFLRHLFTTLHNICSSTD